MASITRFCYIKKHRIFRDFAWHSDLEDFERFNLIYGWNGTGKSTLSHLFSFLEKKRPLTEGEAEVMIDVTRCALRDLAQDTVLPHIRVFNRQYVSANVFASESAMSDVAPIYVLGQDSVEKEKAIQTLKGDLGKEQSRLTEKDKKVKQAKNALDGFCVEHARSIKQLLSSSGSNSYNNYNKGIFKDSCDAFSALADTTSKLLSDEEYASLIRQKESRSKAEVTAISIPIVELNGLTRRTELLLQETAISTKLEELVTNRVVAHWVEQGVVLHTGANSTDTCRFCDSPFSPVRLQALQAHFNEEYKKIITRIDAEITAISQEIQKLNNIHLPHREGLYDHLAELYANPVTEWNLFVESVEKAANKLTDALIDKKQRVFEDVSLADKNGVSIRMPEWETGKQCLKTINALFQRHNEETTGFEAVISSARKRLEEHKVAEVLAEYTSKIKEIAADELALAAHKQRVKEIGIEINGLRKAIEEHRRPAEELNEELKNYLGHDQLTFHIKESGYLLTRGGAPAANLSEGERTAIAFLYFLKSLQDRGFDLKKGIVVIDDPVSSLDSNALFSAFACMKERAKEAGQLFILTHNFALFREVKHWFHNLRGQDRKKARFYMLVPYCIDGERCAKLQPLDRLLREYESEYHYLFKIIHDEATKQTKRELGDFYPLPNLARRLLESFLSFRYPASKTLLDQLQSSSLDPTRRTRLYRFVNVYSHREVIDEQQHDLTLLAETPQILLDLLAFMESEDKKHYGEMLKLVSTAPTA